LQLKLRLVPEIRTLVNKNAKAKVDRLRLRQAAFVGSVLEMTTWEISSLDYVNPALGIDLRGLIKSIRSTASPEMPLFHSIDPRWDGNGCIVTYLPQFEDKAMACVAGLLPYLRHLAGAALHAHIKKLFTMEAIKRSIRLYLDPKERCVVGASDNFLSRGGQRQRPLRFHRNVHQHVDCNGYHSSSIRRSSYSATSCRSRGSFDYGY